MAEGRITKEGECWVWLWLGVKESSGVNEFMSEIQRLLKEGKIMFCEKKRNDEKVLAIILAALTRILENEKVVSCLGVFSNKNGEEKKIGFVDNENCLSLLTKEGFFK